MRILFIDIDSLRPDHMGCYGYHRDTTPHIDAIAARGARFEEIYASDAPCLPSRTALNTGRFGIHTGVCSHHGTAADPFIEGAPRRFFQSELGMTSWAESLRSAGYRTVTFTPFGKRHSAYWWYAGFEEMHAYGSPGTSQAHEDGPRALDWLERNGSEDNWFLHINFWDVHFPYRTPEEYGEPFADSPAPEWYTEEIRQEHWNGVGITSARDLDFSRGKDYEPYPRQPSLFDHMDKVKLMFDSYDTAIRYVDEWVGKLVSKLEALGVREETAIVVTADHGECLGEFNIHCDHRLADYYTHHLPFIVDWPGISSREGFPKVDSELRYHVDCGATILDWAGAKIPSNWDGRSFSEGDGLGPGHPYLTLTYGGCCSVQRAVRFNQGREQFYCMRSYHDGWQCLPDVMLFEMRSDPYSRNDVACERPEVVHEAMYYLTEWQSEMMRTADHPIDPIWTAFQEGPQDLVIPGPELVPNPEYIHQYLAYLDSTGREDFASEIRRKHL